MEVVCALAVLTIISTSVLVGERRQLNGVKRSFDELAASRAAAAHLESLAGPDLVLLTGRRPIPAELAGCRAFEDVRRVSPGLYEVTVTVLRGETELARVTTRIATESGW